MKKQIKNGLANVVDFGGKCCAFVLPIIAGAFLNKMSERVVEKIQYGGKVNYDDAVRTILNSDMLSSCKKEAIGILDKHGDAEYYRAVIYTVDSSLLSSDKINLIKDLKCDSEKEES